MRRLAQAVSPALVALLLCPPSAFAAEKPEPSYYGPPPATESLDLTMYQRIRNEGMTHGKVMEFAAALTDGIGPRLTGSPNMKKANEWTRDTFTRIGLSNAHLEDWGEFGLGWYQVNTWARMISPDPEPLWLQAAPWTIATPGPVSGQVIYMPQVTPEAVEKLKGSLKGQDHPRRRNARDPGHREAALQPLHAGRARRDDRA